MTSNLSDLEHHIAAVSVPILESPVEDFHHSAASPEAHTEGQVNAQVQSDAQDGTSDSVEIPVNIEPRVSTPQDDGKTLETMRNTAEISKSRTIRVKAQRSRPRILTLMVCVLVLLFHLVGIDIGLRAIQAYTEPRLHYAEARLSQTTEVLAVEYLVNMKLDDLLNLDLDRRHMETTYEECLARALHKANQVFRGLDFTSNPYTRNTTVDWATNNCRRLQYTPQVHRSRRFVLQATAEDLRHALGRLLSKAKRRLALLPYLLSTGDFRIASNRIVSPSTVRSNKSPRLLPDMPYGFGLECKEQSQCRLVFTGTASSSTGRMKLEEVVADAHRQVHKWSWKFEKVYGIINCCYGLATFLALLLVGTYLLVSTVAFFCLRSSEPKLPFDPKQTRVWKRIYVSVTRLQPGELHVIRLIIETALYAILGFQLRYMFPEFDRIWLPAGLGFLVSHFARLLAFIFAESSKESLPNAVKAAKELYLISQGVDEPAKGFVAKLNSPAAARPASKIAGRFVSPLTPFAEDLRQHCEALYMEQAKPSTDDVEPQYGYDTEFESEYDSDVQSSTSMDLADDVVLTESGDEDDLVVVEG